MKTLTFFAACLFSIAGFGQTKLISHRSHSGSNAHFRTAIENNLFDIGNSNFGLVVEFKDRVDTVIMKSNNSIIVLRKRTRIVNGEIRTTTFTRDTLTKSTAPVLFEANSMDSLKVQVESMFKPAVLDSATLFIGFDKKFRQKKRTGK